ncbi:hypothetical protein GJAV_G00084830 [Gymnothorax javanicus]|nr:hypothetical protein GJAV_G00084830 [Gymnothorax javanicus]
MSRPRSRSPVHPFRSSSLYRRSPDRYSNRGLEKEMAGFDPRGPADSRWGGGRPSHRSKFDEDFALDSRRRAQSPEHWRYARSDYHKFTGPVDTGDHHHGNFDPAPQLGYAERRRLSPGRQLHTPDDGDGSWRLDPSDDFQRFHDGKPPSPPLRFSQGHDPASHHESATHRMPSPEWPRAHYGGDSEQVPDLACQKSPRHSPRIKQGRYNWIETGSIPEKDVADAEVFHFSDQVHERSPYMERCMEEPQYKRSSERGSDSIWDKHRGTKRAPLIVEHDHGFASHGTIEEPRRERRASDYDRDRDRDRDRDGDRDRDHNRSRTRERPSDRHQRAGRRSSREAPDVSRNMASSDWRPRGRSPIPTRERRWEASPTSSRPPYFSDFREQQELDLKRDGNLRRMEPVETTERNVPPRLPVRMEDPQDGEAVQNRAFFRGGSRSSGAGDTSNSPTRETLTIKVDMQRPAAQDRRLSLDIINVGRQRLNFLPALEDDGNFQENTLHSGTFAQEIISLVHQVKEDYFTGEGPTLNERFSSVGHSQAEDDAQLSNPRVHRRIDMSTSDFKIQPLMEVAGFKQTRQRQLADNPGDLRHDLERRRQERLEGVKITIPGVTFSSRPLLAGSVVSEDEDDEELSSSGHSRRERGVGRADEHFIGDLVNQGQQRRGFIPEDFGPLRKPNHPQNRMGQERQQQAAAAAGEAAAAEGQHRKERYWMVDGSGCMTQSLEGQQCLGDKNHHLSFHKPVLKHFCF